MSGQDAHACPSRQGLTVPRRGSRGSAGPAQNTEAPNPQPWLLSSQSRGQCYGAPGPPGPPSSPQLPPPSSLPSEGSLLPARLQKRLQPHHLHPAVEPDPPWSHPLPGATGQEAHPPSRLLAIVPARPPPVASIGSRRDAPASPSQMSTLSPVGSTRLRPQALSGFPLRCQRLKKQAQGL